METPSNSGSRLAHSPSLLRLQPPELRRMLEAVPVSSLNRGESIWGVGQMVGEFPHGDRGHLARHGVLE
jgi:hypothetical protein